MKSSICCLLFLLFTFPGLYAQPYNFLKKEKPKYTFFSKSTAPAKSNMEKYPPRITIYNISNQVNKPFVYYTPAGYMENKSSGNFLSAVSALAGNVFISIMADKMHYRYPNNPAYYPANYLNRW